MRLSLATQMASYSSLPTHLPDPSTGNAVIITATVVSIVAVLIIIFVVCIVLMAVLTGLKGIHHKHMESQGNACYSTSSRNKQNEIEYQSE